MLLKYFDLYTSMGMKIIPVYPQSKVPVGVRWNVNWNKQRCRGMFESGNYNLGILLGDFVDVEGDTPESNELLLKMIDDIPHPIYRSSRSIHHLFQNPDQELTAIRFHNIEFRGKLHQSVLPPSIHESGNAYCWLRGTKFPIPPMPAKLRDFYFDNRPLKKTRIYKKKRLPYGLRNVTCQVCSFQEIIHEKRLGLEIKAFAEHRLPWMCHKCREIDVREACRRIRKELNQACLMQQK